MGKYDKLLWTVNSKEPLLDCRIFKVEETESVSSEGKKGKFVVLDAPDWAAIVPVIESEGEKFFLMVRQFRHGSQTIGLEFPGGVVERGEDPETAVRRELLEETGYVAARVRKLGSVRPNPAFLNNEFHVFLAEGLERKGEQELDENESLNVEIVPSEAARWALEDDPSAHALMVAALALYDRSCVLASEDDGR
jgi:ADP-ribose pyrophosphatase